MKILIIDMTESDIQDLKIVCDFFSKGTGRVSFGKFMLERKDSVESNDNITLTIFDCPEVK